MSVAVAPAVRAGKGHQGEGHRRAPFVVLVIASALLFANLGSPLLWQDEAQTALVSRTLLTHGTPRGTDGINSFSQERGADFRSDYTWRWHPWFPFYLLAGSFAVFGQSTFVARLPFALFGLGTVVGVMLLAGDLWRSRRAAIVAGALMTLNVPFLILARQCRYYSVAVFLSVATLLIYRWLLVDRPYAIPGFIGCSVLLFHTQPLYFGALVSTVLVDAAVGHRNRLSRTAAACVISISLALPWYLWMGRAHYGDRYAVMNAGAMGECLLSFLSQLERWIVPWPFLLLASVLVAFAIRDRGKARRLVFAALLPVLFVGANLAGLTLATFTTFFRYLAPVIPMCAILAAGIIDAVMSWKVAAGLTLAASALVGQPYGKFAYELTHRFQGPVEAIVSFLRANARPGDVVAITYGDMPLKFYTPLRVVGGLTGEDLGPARNADWIVIRQYQITDEDARVADYLKSHVPWWKYRGITLDGPDTPWENREGPQEHLFKTATWERPVVIYKRMIP